MSRSHELSLPDERSTDTFEQPNRAYRILRLGEQALAQQTESHQALCAHCEPSVRLVADQPELPFEFEPAL